MNNYDIIVSSKALAIAKFPVLSKRTSGSLARCRRELKQRFMAFAIDNI